MPRKIQTDIPAQLQKCKVFTVAVIIKLLGCSSQTARRRLKDWKVYTSYNHNAKYHVLRDAPRFDEHGIWRYDGIFFSRHGNLTRTVIKLVEDSSEGLEAQKMCAILGVTAASLYTHFRGIKQLKQRRFGRTLVYFSARQDIYKRQVAQRDDTVASRAIANTLPAHADAILMLVDRIKHPDDTIEQCARRLHRISPTIAPQTVSAVLQQHDLLKKTPDTP